MPVSEFAADEVAFGLRMTWTAAAGRVAYACDLAGRLPVTFAALGAGLIDPVHAKIIFEQTGYLSAVDAAKADPVLAAAAQVKTYGELLAAAARLVLRLDQDSAERRKQARRQEAHVRPFREDSGNAGMTAREMPADEVLASWQHVDQRARDLRAAGVPGTLRELRVRAYLDLLQERDSRDALPGHPDGNDGPDDGPGAPDGPGGSTGPGNGPAARAGAGSSGPSLAALVNITVSLPTLFGESGTPGEAAGFGLLDPATARDLIAAAARNPRTRWCVTAPRRDRRRPRLRPRPAPRPTRPARTRPRTTGPGTPRERVPGPRPAGHRTPRTTRCRPPRHHLRPGPAAPARHPGPGLPEQPAGHAHPPSPAAPATTGTPRPGTSPAASCST